MPLARLNPFSKLWKDDSIGRVVGRKNHSSKPFYLISKAYSKLWPPFFPAAWPAQLCHQGSNSLLPRQVAHRLSKCLGPPLGIFTRPLWPWNDLTFGQNILWVHICAHEFFDGRIITKSWLKLQFNIALLLRQEKFMELYGICCMLPKYGGICRGGVRL